MILLFILKQFYLYPRAGPEAALRPSGQEEGRTLLAPPLQNDDLQENETALEKGQGGFILR